MGEFSPNAEFLVWCLQMPCLMPCLLTKQRWCVLVYRSSGKNNLVSAQFEMASGCPVFFHCENGTLLIEIYARRSDTFFFLLGILFPFFFFLTNIFSFSSCRLKEERETCLAIEDAVLVFSYLS